MPTQSYNVLYPETLSSSPHGAKLFGFIHPDSFTINIVGVGSETVAKAPEIGVLSSSRECLEEKTAKLCAFVTPEGVDFRYRKQSCTSEAYSLISTIFNRHSGIIETKDLLDSGVVISGCGSVGSLAALELARCGVGHFLLVDPEILEYHNLCRHQCSIRDVGRYKTEAVRQRILDINPSADVQSSTTTIERVEKVRFDRFLGMRSVLIGCGDNRASDLYLNRIASLYRVPMVSIGLWKKAFAGEIFWAIPGETPCYHCVFGGLGSVFDGRSNQSRHVYQGEEAIAREQFEPAISPDINLVTEVGIKLALDLLGPQHRVRLKKFLTQFTLICNSIAPELGGDLVELFDHPLQVTRSIEVAFADNCPHCSLARGRAAVAGG